MIIFVENLQLFHRKNVISMSEQSHRLILASQSPQRRTLLTDVGYTFDVIAPSDGAECGVCSGETPSELVARLSRQKAGDVAERIEAGIVLGCDTVAECAGRILGKPRDADHARQMLTLLRGRVHHVYSGLCLWRRPADSVLVKVDTTKLKMAEITDNELDAYVESDAWIGKAGGFGYQDRPEWLEILAGSESNVIGLPLELLGQMLSARA